MKITVKVHSQEDYTLSCVLEDRLVWLRYIGYSKREAIKRFKEYVKTQK